MLQIKNELRSIILGDEQTGDASQLKTMQNFLRRNAKIHYGSPDKKSIKRKEEEFILNLIPIQNLI